MSMEKIDPTTIVIFGVTGDLTNRKLLPSLFELYCNDLLPVDFKIVGLARRKYTNEEYRKKVEEVLLAYKKDLSTEKIGNFLDLVQYVVGDFGELKDYARLADVLLAVDDNFGHCSNKLFYLAVPPSFYDSIFVNLSNSGLTIPCGGGGDGWTRVLVEKPFGKDLQGAIDLDVELAKLFSERQIFRIDHYLAKEAMQNILAFRFSNALFEPIWNKEHIEKIEIKLNETIGVEKRGAFYDGIGALRDVGQNHMLQMLALVAMENPTELNANFIRKNRANVLGALVRMSGDAVKKNVLRGQYEGFKNEPNVSVESKTETYFSIKAFVNNDRWMGVPFYLESGKKMNTANAEISVYFKKTETCICADKDKHEPHQNILTFRIQPNEEISVLFWAKKPGFNMELEKKNLSFSYNENGDAKMTDAYQKVLFDCIKGDQSLFTSTQEVVYAWSFIASIINAWDEIPLKIYKQGASSEEIKS